MMETIETLFTIAILLGSAPILWEMVRDYTTWENGR